VAVKILVVDDDQQTREALASILWRAGYEVTLLESGKHL
jgi:CheY-like chemotaxis protein